MPVVVDEKYVSRTLTNDAENPQVELLYQARGSSDDAEILAAIGGATAPFYGLLVRQSIALSELGGGHWESRVTYGKRQKLEVGGSQYSFDTGGGTQKRLHSIQTRARYAPPGKTAPDCKGLIGVTKDSVEGVEVTVPIYNFSETHILPASQVTQAYKANLYLCTGGVNASSFRGFASGEVLFLGASGSNRSPDEVELAFKFSASPNANDLVVGDITGIQKFGWDYLWVLYQDTDDANVLVKKPIGVYVEQVAFARNFSLLGIGA